MTCLHGCALAAAVLLPATFLAACGGAGDVAEGSGNVQEAVDHIAVDATYAAITDWEAVREQNPEIGTDSEAGIRQLANVPTNSKLAPFAQVMEDDYGWNVVADAEWDLTYANYGAQGGPVPNLVKVGDSVDLDDFQAKLEEKGFSENEVESGTLWSIDIEDVDPSQSQATTWLVDEDERIVLAGLLPADDALTADGDPSDEMQQIADQAGDATVIRLTVGVSACSLSEVAPGRDPSQIEEQLAERADLERPTARAETWTGTAGSSLDDAGDTTAKTILLFDSDDAAKSDHEARLVDIQRWTVAGDPAALHRARLAGGRRGVGQHVDVHVRRHDQPDLPGRGPAGLAVRLLPFLTLLPLTLRRVRAGHSARSIVAMEDDGYDERPPLIHTHTQHGIPQDAQLMGFDRNTEEGALIGMMGSLDSAKPVHKMVAWVLLVAFSLPLLLTVWNYIF